MKDIKFHALSEIKFGEIGDFLRWFDQVHSGLITLRQIRDYSSMKPGKLNSMIKLLEEFGFIFLAGDEIDLTEAGREFSRFNLIHKMKTIRSILRYSEQGQEVMELLQKSQTRRLKARVVYYALKEGYEQLTEIDMRGFINWAHWSELFHYDKKHDEIHLMVDRLPTGAMWAVS
jgi:hypothetical protein